MTENCAFVIGFLFLSAGSSLGFKCHPCRHCAGVRFCGLVLRDFVFSGDVRA
jgi:hypothetical protein